MDVNRRIVGAAVPDERQLAGTLLGWMFIVGSLVTVVLPMLPGVDGVVISPTLTISLAALTWGVLAVRMVDWGTTPGWVLHVCTILGALGIAIAVADNGGAQSPARLLYMFTLVFASYFYPPREAWPYLGLVLGLHELPLAYDPHAISEGLLGDLLILVPCYGLLAFLLISGKRVMIELRARADELARTDELTGLANRRALIEAIDGAGGRARGERLGLLMLDVDDFKAVNTHHGHPGGDRALRFVADCLRGNCRVGDVPARLGGDEFAVLVPEIDEDGMEAFAQRVLEAVRASDLVRVSVGWAIADGSWRTLLRDADEALSAAKRGGKDRVLSVARG